MVIPTSMPIIDVEMEEEVIRALREEFFVGGESVEKFEDEFADYIGADYAVAVGSGTDALVIALRILGIKKKVITTPMTFVATAESIVLAGATPKFADICADTWNISAEEIEKQIDKDVEAIMPVHLYGLPCDMGAIMDIAADNNLHIIEDSAQAHGAEHNSKKVGTFGDIGCFSFYSTKNMTVAGDGGMITTNSNKEAEMAQLLRDHGGSNYCQYVGYNARLNTINAAFGRVQLKRLDVWNRSRREIAERYYEKLSDIEEIKLPVWEKGHVYHLFVIQAKERDKLRVYLGSNGIKCGIHYPIPIHQLAPYSEYADQNYTNSEYHANTALSLPMYPTLRGIELDLVCSKIKGFYGDRLK
uniref:UDP-4-amino-4-deoxy-L-arabinose--oxoglutarate aminotransferase n=1 Tax=Candidatus Methanophaga sp. ANME-1 ERB7 TaxID=2759913 RepID=A0A7G9Z3P0_9EURY|nr:UDP-4-amino-4-deoxy-L-arabinose--oxoglutarate aminotransferase [Methanosarcinales archaeon ANME-1 ERB7]